MPRAQQPTTADRVMRAQRQGAAAELAKKAAATLDKPSADASGEQKLGNSVKVCVACKVPTGMILRLFRMTDRQEPVMGGGMRVFQQSEAIPGARIRVNGPAIPFGSLPNYSLSDGCAFTNNVDREFWVKWLEQNHDHDAVVNGMIFAEKDEASARAKAKEQTKVLSGQQPMMPDNDLRMPKLKNENLSDVETEEERKKKLQTAA